MQDFVHQQYGNFRWVLHVNFFPTFCVDGGCATKASNASVFWIPTKTTCTSWGWELISYILYRLYVVCVHPSSFSVMIHVSYIYNLYYINRICTVDSLCTVELYLSGMRSTIWFVSKSHDCNHSSASRCISGQPWRTKFLVAEWNASWGLPQNFLRFNHGGVANPKHHSTSRDVCLPPKTWGW